VRIEELFLGFLSVTQIGESDFHFMLEFADMPTRSRSAATTAEPER
jgi:hypothetical protein